MRGKKDEQNMEHFSENRSEEEGRPKAMMYFKKREGATEHVDYDLYGRKDIPIFSDLSTTDKEATENKSGGTYNERGKSWKSKFMAVRVVGRKVKVFARKLSNTINCFGKAGLKMATGDAVDAESPISSETHRTHLETAAQSPDSSHIATADVSVHLEDAGNAMDTSPEAEMEENNENDTEELECKQFSCYVEDDTPRRVKSKAGSVESTSVIEKGIVVNTLAKLRSTGSSLFQESQSPESEDGGDKTNAFHFKKLCYQRSNSSGVRIHEAAASDNQEKAIGDYCMHSGNEPDSSSVNSAVDQADTRIIDRSCVTETEDAAPALRTPAGNVEKLASLYEEDISDDCREVVVQIIPTLRGREGENANHNTMHKSKISCSCSKHSTPRDTTCRSEVCKGSPFTHEIAEQKAMLLPKLLHMDCKVGGGRFVRHEPNQSATSREILRRVPFVPSYLSTKVKRDKSDHALNRSHREVSPPP